jgi:hypothetical protein
MLLEGEPICSHIHQSVEITVRGSGRRGQGGSDQGACLRAAKVVLSGLCSDLMSIYFCWNVLHASNDELDHSINHQ